MHRPSQCLFVCVRSSEGSNSKQKPVAQSVWVRPRRVGIKAEICCVYTKEAQRGDVENRAEMDSKKKTNEKICDDAAETENELDELIVRNDFNISSIICMF